MLLSGGRRFLIVGHRGAAARAPENTAASLRAGIDAGADAIELDVGLSADGRAVVLHDATLDRTTDGRGPVDALPWKDLARLDAGSWFGERFRGERLLDLDGALAVVRARAPVLVEIKAKGADDARPGARDRRLARAVVLALERTGGFAGATVSSSAWPVLDVVAEDAPGLARALTVRWREGRDPVVWAARSGASALHPNRRLCSPRFVARARGSGLGVVAYTVNRVAEARALLAAGADGVFSDDPRALLRALRGRPSRSRPDRLFLGIDQGSGGTRAVLVSRTGEIAAGRSARVPSRRLADGTTIQDADAIADSVRRAAGPLVEDRVRAIAGTGLAVQRGALLVWRRSDGAPVTPVLSWRVGERDAAPTLPPGLDEAAIAARTGLTSRYPYGAIRLAKLLASDTAIAAGIRRGRLVAGPLGSFLLSRLGLGRETIVDPSLAQRMLLLDATRLDWDRDLAAAFGIPVDALPRVAPSVAAHGSIRPGLGRLRLTALAGDVGAAARAALDPRSGVFLDWGTGFHRDGAGDPPLSREGESSTGLLVLGTGGFVVAPSDGRRAPVPGLLSSILWSDPGGPRRAIEGTVHGLAASIAEAGRLAGCVTDDLALVAARAGTARRSAPVDAAPEGTGTPDWDLTPRFTVGPGAHAPEEIVRGTIESLASRFGSIAGRLRAEGALPTRFVAAGGLAASPHLLAAISRALSAPAAADPRPERSAVGAALLAGDLDGD